MFLGLLGGPLGERGAVVGGCLGGVGRGLCALEVGGGCICMCLSLVGLVQGR